MVSSAATATQTETGSTRPARPRRKVGVWVALFIILLLFALALSAPLWADDPARQSLMDAELPPYPLENSTVEHLLGTDELGRDQLSRILFGLRTSMSISILSMLLAAAIGTSVGVIAGFFRGIVDEVLMRIVDIQMSFPAILLVVTFVTAIGPSFQSIVIVLALSIWVVFARVARAQVLALRDSDLVLAMRAIGASTPRVLLLHIVPNIAGPLIVIATLEFATLIVAESALGYLGLGVPPPTPSLGAMIATGQFGLITGVWWLVLGPGIAMTAFIMSINILGDWLRDRLDPRR
ncbi:ABC transporter permease [Nitratireductor pacificus]|uniref:Binding-protein-dependent transport systems inner membrane component n=1 Tax=Nitratireductor pacificus pht-3B TaxID=391937 RepID=K2M8V9_9HYPH|nr:ABC transporter permease [Nitratireductor pacificus]EKF18566.1 binding-protein-dependent transport systems inner membrane component [Nitratireductor pacificus pht-3B]